MSNCHCNSSINLDGSGQLGRYLKALDPSYAAVDDRSIEDLLVFAKRYAGQIRFYDVPDSMNENEKEQKSAPVTWREFFRRDMAVIAASIAVIDLAQIRKDYDETRTRLEQHPTGDVYAALYSVILGMASRIDHWYSSSLPEYPLRKDLDLGISSSLRPAMMQVMGYEKGFVMVDGKMLKLDYSAITNTALWGLDEEVVTDATIYTGATTGEKILNAALFVDDVFLVYYSFLQKLVAGSDDYLKHALEQYPAHQPHMALFIAFLEIFRLAQDQMNGLTGRMLDFYYRDVLHLEERTSVPDRVHLIFELAKDVSEYDLEKATALLAGKDALGKDQVYKTEEDIVINSAKVKELKTLFVQKKAGIAETDPKLITAFYAMQVANSSDGNGAKFTEPNPKWPSLGVGWPVIDDPQNICEAISAVQELGQAPVAAQVGFAIATPQLLLQSGKRLIKIGFSGLDTLAAYAGESGAAVFDIYLTGEKSWLQVGLFNNGSEAEDALVDALANGVFEEDAIDEPGYFIRLEDGIAALYVYLPIAAPPIIGYDAKLHTDGTYSTKQPIMKILLSSDISVTEADYASVKLSKLSVEVKVGSINDYYGKNIEVRLDGLKTLVLQNDNGLLDPTKPFDPFTAYPAPGKSLYIGSSELFNKSLGEIGVNIRKTQDALSGNESGDDNYDYRVKVLDHRQWISLYSQNSEVFTRQYLTENILRVRAINNSTTGEFDTMPYPMNRKPLSEVKQWDGKEEKGFIRIDYAPDSDGNYYFNAEQSRDLAPQYEVKEISVSYHSVLNKLEAGIDQLFHVYPFGVAEVNLQVRNVKKDLAEGVNRISLQNTSTTLVNAYNHLLPQFTYTSLYNRYKVEAGSIAVKYGDLSNVVVVNSGSYGTEWISKRFPKRADQLMLEASGLKEQESGQLNQYSATLQEEGLLFIGLEKSKPLQTVSLLFQFAEGSAMDEDNDPPHIHWTYLVNNEWRPLKAEHVIADDTFGFQTTGIIKLEIPADATNGHSIITDGLYWFGASVSSFSDRIPQLVDVVAQAVVARFEDNQNASAHFDVALPAGSISKLAVSAASIGKVAQPFSSFDGKHKAVGKEFYMQVSERLRHKGRAVNSWDYEHLVLDRFPSIYKVKCIQHTDPNCLCRESATVSVSETREGGVKVDQLGGATNKDPKQVSLDANGNSSEVVRACCGPQIAPGHVLIVPIANLKSRNAANPLQPKTSRRTLLEIQDYLKKRVSPFVHVHARNPVYEQIMVFFRVQFIAGASKGFFLKKLNDEIVRYLTPWAFDEQAEVVFGQKVYASSIINFIEERPYVDFITDFIMDVCLHECCPPAVSENGDQNGDNIGNNNGGGEKAESDNDGTASLFTKVHGCDDMEALISSADFTGYVVATPSTARSILVSVPQHIIVPYEAPDKLSPCQQRKKAVPIVTLPNIPEKPTRQVPAKDVQVIEPVFDKQAEEVKLAGEQSAKDKIDEARARVAIENPLVSKDISLDEKKADVRKVADAKDVIDEQKISLDKDATAKRLATEKDVVKKVVDPTVALKKIAKKTTPKNPGK